MGMTREWMIFWMVKLKKNRQRRRLVIRKIGALDIAGSWMLQGQLRHEGEHASNKS